MHPSLASRLGKVAIVGGGKMGEAMLSGLLSAGAVNASDVVVANPGEEKRARLREIYGVECLPSAVGCEGIDTCLLAVKPQIIRDVMEELRSSGFSPARVFSVAAGTTTATIAEYFPQAGVVRAMPNMPLVYGHGVTGISGGDGTSESDVDLAAEMFGCMGVAEVVSESLQDAVVAVSGSGPAYFALFVDEVARAGEKLGLDRQTALHMALHTMDGTARLLESGGMDPAQLIENACTPGGTTEAAVGAMRSSGISEAISAGVAAACQRSKELS